MSKTIKCDMCGKTEPDVNCRYSKRRKWAWFRFYDDSQGGHDRELDICEGCWYIHKQHRQLTAELATANKELERVRGITVDDIEKRMVICSSEHDCCHSCVEENIGHGDGISHCCCKYISDLSTSIHALINRQEEK